MTRLRKHIRNEDGVAMIIVMGVMATLLVLTSVVVSSSNLVGQNTRQDTARKRAFEAAEAGLQATVYRLNMLGPANNMCIGGASETVQAPSGTTCAPYTEDLGNGASFTSWTTTTLGSGATCAGLDVGSGSSIAERCVTASGTVAGVTRRVQTRVASYDGVPLFPITGVTGLRSVFVNQNGHIVGGTGSNGQITVENNGTTSSATIGPSAPNVIVGNNGSSGPVTRRSATQGPFQLAPVDPGNSVTTNDNGRLSNAFANPPVSPYDSVSSGVTYDAATRTLALGNGESVSLGGALYNFCQLSMDNNSTITLAPGARTAIYIDSPDRAGSGCPAASGTLTMSNNTSFVNNSPPVAGSGFSHDPTALQLYVVGKANTAVTLRNNADFYGTVYAPTSLVYLWNNAGTWGAVAANDVDVLNNAVITADPNAANIRTSTGAGVYFRSAWRECLATATTTDPGSGC
jgi:Tfp pilus assembly protein PilX